MQAAPKVDKYPELEKMMEEKDTKGTETPVKIVFRAVNTFDLWVHSYMQMLVFFLQPGMDGCDVQWDSVPNLAH